MRRVRIHPRSGLHMVQPGTEVANEREKGDASPQGVCVVASHSPLRGLLISDLRPHGLQPWAAFYRRFAAWSGPFFHSFQTHDQAMTQTPKGRHGPWRTPVIPRGSRKEQVPKRGPAQSRKRCQVLTRSLTLA
jgi:hypothetical protein